jgi:NADH-quinone oxidoreductase subunit L
MALVNRDLKRIIAYSTLSQLGYMFAAAGLGAYWVALFHLAAHAFFKALLFLGAGNVMHAMNDELDIFKMGGLRKKMRWTFLYMGLASLALAGIWPLAGFYSKDTILEVAFNEHTYGIWFVLWLTAGLTAFYSFRQVFLTFMSDERYKEHGFHPHEVQKFVLWGLSPLALLAVVFGWWHESFMEFAVRMLPAYEMSEGTHHMVTTLIIMTSAIAIGGIILAYLLYARKLIRRERIENSLPYRILSKQYYIPILYEKAISRPYAEISRVAWKELDMQIVDATVDGIAKTIESSGNSTRKMQTGNLSDYLKWMAAGVIILSLVALAVTMKS